MSTSNVPQKTVNPWAQKIAGASASGGGNWIDKHGRYQMCVKEVQDKRELFDAQGRKIQEKGFKGNSIIFRVQVMESAKRVATQVDDAHPVGDVRSVVFNFDDKSNMAAGKLKALLMAIFDKSERDMTIDFVDEALSIITAPDQPILGKLVGCETYDFTTKAKTTGIGVTWSPVPQFETADDKKAGAADDPRHRFPTIAEMRAKLLGGV